MKTNYDFSKARRAKDVPHLAQMQETERKSKTRITIMLDDDVIEGYRKLAGPSGAYQTEINRALRAHLAETGESVNAEQLRAELDRFSKGVVDKVRATVRKELHGSQEPGG